MKVCVCVRLCFFIPSFFAASLQYTFFSVHAGASAGEGKGACCFMREVSTALGRPGCGACFTNRVLWALVLKLGVSKRWGDATNSCFQHVFVLLRRGAT